MTLTLGVDVGGTKVAAGVVDAGGRILAKTRRPTPSTDPVQTADAIASAASGLAQEHDIGAVGVGAAGFVDADRSVVLFAPNLSWRNEPLQQELQRRIGLPVVVENDANAMGWAESEFGAGRGENFLVCLTLGTGIGSGIVLDGKLFRGRWGVGGELGHIRVVPGGRRCGCGNRGCWEQYASGHALVAEARELARASPAVARRLGQADGREEGDLTGPEITRAALDGDSWALECFRTVGGWLGSGLADVAAAFDPGRYVIGGGLADAGDVLLEPAREAFEETLTGRGHRPIADLRPAELGPDAGLVGAADLARRR